MARVLAFALGGSNIYLNFGQNYNLNFTVAVVDIYFNYTEGYIRSNKSRTYDNINIVNGSKFDELEVFQIIGKN